MTRFAPVLLAALLPLGASAKVLWRADYETGDLSQWSGNPEEVAPDRLLVQTDVVKEGRYALKATVIQGDNPINGSGNRNELWDNSFAPEGAERWYRWYTYFDPSFPSVNTWQLFTQWHQYELYAGSPPIEFYVNGEDMYLGSHGSSVLWKGPLKRGTWIKFLFHVRWSKDANAGFLELYVDDQLVLPKTTWLTDSNVYLKQGLYRNASIQQTGILFHDGMVEGETRDDVDPAVAPQPQPQPDPSPAPAPAPSDPTPTPTTTTDSTPVPLNQGGDPQAVAEAHAGCSATGAGLLPAFGVAMALALALSTRRRLALAKQRRR